MFNRPPVLIRSAVLACALAIAATLAATTGVRAQAGPVPGDEGAIQAYLAVWSRNDAINAAVVRRFYAPVVDYYGKRMTRAQVLADKLRYIRAWPVRRYREIPGSIAAHCNADRSRCRVRIVMAWRRVGRRGQTSTGRARVAFDFVPVEGGRKIAHESARDL